MGVVVIVGTDKGGVLLRADDAREHWEIGALGFRGWRVTSAARDPGGRVSSEAMTAASPGSRCSV